MNKQDGFVLPLLLLATVIVGILLSSSFQLWSEQRERFHGLINRLRFEQDEAEALKKRVEELQTKALWHLPPLLWGNSKQRAEDPWLSAVILKKQARVGQSALPAWSVLKQEGGEGLCKREVRAEKADISHPVSCTELASLRPGIQFVNANLDVPVLKFQRNVVTKSILAVAGSVHIERLEFDSKDSALTIIALGNIEITQLHPSYRSRGSIFFSSSLGSVHLQVFPESLLSCLETRSGLDLESLSLSIEAADELYLAGVKQEQRLLGCHFERENRVWPLQQLLGGPA